MKILLKWQHFQQDCLAGVHLGKKKMLRKPTGCRGRPGEVYVVVNPWCVIGSRAVLCVLCLVAQSCPTLCHPMYYSPPGSSVHGDSPGKNTGVSCHALLQGICPTQGSNPDLLHCRWILYLLGHQGSPV